jgi:predicted dehydrogenase
VLFWDSFDVFTHNVFLRQLKPGVYILGDLIDCVVIGLGRIGSTLEFDKLREKPASHAGAIFAHPQCRLTAGCDIDPQKRQSFQQSWSVEQVFADTATLLQNIQPQIAVVATPPATHLAIVEQLCRDQVPVIICEKPLADNLPQAQAVVRLVEQSSSQVIINYERRYSRDYVFLQDLIRRQKYGELLSVRAVVYMGRCRTPAEILKEDSCHMIDVVRFLIGQELKITAAAGLPLQKGGTIIMSGNCGAVWVTIETGGSRDHLVFEADLSFARGRVRIGNGLYEEHVSAEPVFYEQMRSLSPVASTPDFTTTGYLANMLAEAVALVHGHCQTPRAGIYDGLASIRIIQGVLQILNPE